MKICVFGTITYENSVIQKTSELFGGSGTSNSQLPFKHFNILDVSACLERLLGGWLLSVVGLIENYFIFLKIIKIYSF